MRKENLIKLSTLKKYRHFYNDSIFESFSISQELKIAIQDLIYQLRLGPSKQQH